MELIYTKKFTQLSYNVRFIKKILLPLPMRTSYLEAPLLKLTSLERKRPFLPYLTRFWFEDIPALFKKKSKKAEKKSKDEL